MQQYSDRGEVSDLSYAEFQSQEAPTARQLHRFGALAAGGAGINIQGETMGQVVEQLEIPSVNYLGRIKFGKGNINAEHINDSQFIELLEEVKNNCLVFASDLRELHGSCMDGRDDVATEAGKDVRPRPKLIGGPSLFAWYVASIGQFEIISGHAEPINQFAIVNQRLMDRGIFLGMHHECGAARNIQPITENYFNEYDNIQQLIGRQARLLTELKHGKRFMQEIKDGVGQTHDLAEKAGDNFTETKMLEVVRSIGGSNAVVHLAVNHDHPTDGHTEGGLVFMRMKNAIIDKHKVNTTTDHNLFYNNSLYAEMIVAALATSADEYAKGQIISDELPIAGVASLGQGQHVGELNGQYLLAA